MKVYPSPGAVIGKVSRTARTGNWIAGSIRQNEEKIMTGEQLAGIVRAVIAALGGYFVGQGMVDAETVTTVGGAAATLAATLWSVYAKRKAE